MVYRTTSKMAERKRARRDRLLHVAIRVFGRKGYHAATVPMIVAAARASTGSFYSYFRNKEDIYAAALEAVGERISSALNEAIAAAGPQILLQMRTAVRALVRFLVENPEEARILIIESSGLGKRLDAVRRKIVDSHTRSVERALTALGRQLPAMETAVTASCWVGAVYEAVFHWLEQPPAERVPAERLAQAIANFNLRGVGAPAAVVEEGGVKC